MAAGGVPAVGSAVAGRGAVRSPGRRGGADGGVVRGGRPRGRGRGGAPPAGVQPYRAAALRATTRRLVAISARKRTLSARLLAEITSGRWARGSAAHHFGVEHVDHREAVARRIVQQPSCAATLLKARL